MTFKADLSWLRDYTDLVRLSERKRSEKETERGGEEFLDHNDWNAGALACNAGSSGVMEFRFFQVE